MTAKPIKMLELHYPMIQLLRKSDICSDTHYLFILENMEFAKHLASEELMRLF